MSDNTPSEAPETGAGNKNNTETKPAASNKARGGKGKGKGKGKGRGSGAANGRQRTAALASRDHTATSDDQKAVQNALGRLVDWAGDNRAEVKGRLRRQDGLLPGDEAWMRTYCAPKVGGMPWTRAMIRLHPGDTAPAGYEEHEIQVRAGDDTFALRVATLVCNDTFEGARVYYEQAWALGVHPRAKAAGPVTMWDGAVVYGGKSDDFRGRMWASTPSGPREKYRGYLSQGAHKHTEFVLMLLCGMSLWVRAARMPDEEKVPKVVETAMLTRYKYMLNIQENGGKRFPAWLVNMDVALFGTRSSDPMREALASRPEDVRKRFGVPFVGVEGRPFPFKMQTVTPGYFMPEQALALTTQLNTPAYVKFLQAGLPTAALVKTVATATAAPNDATPGAAADDAAGATAGATAGAAAKSWAELPHEAQSTAKPPDSAPSSSSAPPKARTSPPAASGGTSPKGGGQHYWWPDQVAEKCAAFPLGKDEVCGYKAADNTRFCRRHKAWLERWSAAAKTPATN